MPASRRTPIPAVSRPQGADRLGAAASYRIRKHTVQHAPMASIFLLQTSHAGHTLPFEMVAFLLLTIGRFLLTAELFCLQLCLGVFVCLQLELFYLQLELLPLTAMLVQVWRYSERGGSFLLTVGAFLLTVGECV